MNSPYTDMLLGAYNLEKRKLGELEGFAVLQHLQLLSDEIEQAREEQQNELGFHQFEQCDHILDWYSHDLNQIITVSSCDNSNGAIPIDKQIKEVNRNQGILA